MQNSNVKSSPNRGFTVQKYRSAIYYLNYSVRQMRLDSDIDNLIQRQESKLHRKLKVLDEYPNVQNFIQDLNASGNALLLT